MESPPAHGRRFVAEPSTALDQAPLGQPVALNIAGISLESYENHVEAWHWLDQHQDEVNWHRGAVANSLVVSYGEKTLERFGQDVGCSLRTVQAYRQVAAELDEKRIRIRNLSWNHHRFVLGARPDDRLGLLEEAAAEGWSVRDLRRVVAERYSAPTPALPSPPTEGDGFSVIVADPPWAYDEGWPEYNDQIGQKNERIALPYQSMSLDEIHDLSVAKLAAPDAHLFLWTTNRYVRDAYEVAESWGFSPSQLLVWAKPPRGIGPGGVFSNTAEFVVYARRGTPQHNHRIDSTWWEWPRGRHSAKPAPFLEMVEQAFPGPYLEMFCRTPREGWETWGLEVAA